MKGNSNSHVVERLSAVKQLSLPTAEVTAPVCSKEISLQSTFNKKVPRIPAVIDGEPQRWRATVLQSQSVSIPKGAIWQHQEKRVSACCYCFEAPI